MKSRSQPTLFPIDMAKSGEYTFNSLIYNSRCKKRRNEYEKRVYIYIYIKVDSGPRRQNRIGARFTMQRPLKTALYGALSPWVVRGWTSLQALSGSAQERRRSLRTTRQRWNPVESEIEPERVLNHSSSSSSRLYFSSLSLKQSLRMSSTVQRRAINSLTSLQGYITLFSHLRETYYRVP